MKVRLICVGKIKEDFYTKAVEEYKKRLNAYCDFQIVEVKEVNTNDINKNIYEEGKLILENVHNDDFLMTLEIKGKELDSVELADFIKNHYTYESSVITFVIGGSNGLSEEVIKRSNYHLSFSKFTFPHQLMRVILTEQIYRAFTIINNKTYHK